MAERECPACDEPLPPDAHPLRVYCNKVCRKVAERRRKRWRYRNDPEYRDKHAAYKRDLLLVNPRYRARKNKADRERYANNSDLRELNKQRSREYYKKNRERLKKAARVRHAQKRQIQEGKARTAKRKLRFVFKPKEQP